jgi:hypothetical protein
MYFFYLFTAIKLIKIKDFLMFPKLISVIIKHYLYIIHNMLFKPKCDLQLLHTDYLYLISYSISFFTHLSAVLNHHLEVLFKIFEFINNHCSESKTNYFAILTL